jgi:ribosomal protein S18 acetylase RimI-like enzyme
MGNYPIIIEKNPASEDLRFLMQKLHEYNVSQTGLEGDLISLFLKDGEQQIIGGLHGWTAFNYLHIDVLWLREDLRRRGYGRRLMQVAEEEALKRGCRYAQLDTFSFQALGFYEKLGYRIFGELGDVAGGHKWYFLKKDLC